VAYVDFLSVIHKSTRRDYLARVTDPEFPKARAAELAKKWDYDYWDGDRRVNYGGYHYDGRWEKVARAIADHYGLKPGDRILDIGCGKGFLLYDFTRVIPGVEVWGIDISAYAVSKAKDEVRERVQEANATALPFAEGSFDLVVSINTLHNLYCYELEQALREIERVGRQHKYICVESYRSEQEKANLLYWQVTCEAFNTPAEWAWWFGLTGYTGDHSFIFFE
jgi:protein-L-isoaspartate(D-aspartate) O-methyltransferase